MTNRKYFSLLPVLFFLLIISMDFSQSGLLFSALSETSQGSRLFASDLGKCFPSEKTTWTDPVTGTVLTVLTHSRVNDHKPYQTHETWTADGKWIVFRSGRNRRNVQLFLVNEETGTIVQVTDCPVLDSLSYNLSRKEMKLFYIRGYKDQPHRELIETDLGKLLPDALAGKVGRASDYERVITVFPQPLRGTGYALDADDSLYYCGVVFSGPEKLDRRNPSADICKSGIIAVDTKSGKTRTVLDNIPFRIGHLQANRVVPGELAYCHETGGDAPQRMWYVKADGTENRALYKEVPGEWITHESLAGADEMVFIISGHSQKLRLRPSGIATVNLRTQAVKLVGQTEVAKGGYWHCNASPDGKWWVGDTHAGSIWVIDQKTGKQTLLSTGHSMRPDHAHPIFSPDSKRILIQSSICTEGKLLNLITIPL